MKVCDKCQTKFDKEVEPTKIGKESFDLCEKCIERIVNHIKEPEKRGMI